MANDKPSLKKSNSYNRKDKTINFEQFNLDNIPPIPRKNIIIIVLFIVLVLIMILTINTPDTPSSVNNSDEVEEIVATTTQLGNNSLGSVYKEGPYGNNSSDVKIAYILGVHPREQGAHRLFENAFKEKEDGLQYCYYIYHVNVTEDPTDFSLSRLNGQKLAKEFIVNDIVNNNFTFAVDAHYSNGAWGVSRFVFTPRENNTLSSMLGHSIADNFDWLTYFTPSNPTSPEYLTSPLNDEGVGAIIYEAYTEDNNNVTLEHNKQIVDYIDNWNFTSSNNTA